MLTIFLKKREKILQDANKKLHTLIKAVKTINLKKVSLKVPILL